MKANLHRTAICSALALGLGATFAVAQTLPVARAEGRVMPMTPGVCLEVADGDTVTMEWNPAFDDMTNVSGLREMSLLFAKSGEQRLAMRTHSGLRLFAARKRPLPGETDDTILAKPNGFYQIQIRIGRAAPGEYRLIDAQAQARLPDNFPGRHPEMTNNPARMPFCLNVPEPTTRGRPQSR